MAIKISCIQKSDRMNPHERIHSVGGVNPDGKRWKLTEDEAISYIQSGQYAFYVERPTGHRVDVIIAESRWGNKYLKTTDDGEQPDNLLALPTCP